MNELTPKQMKLLEWIEGYVREKGFMPSRREMAVGLGVSSVATIQQHVEALESKGFLKLREGEFRGVEFSRRWEKKKSEIELARESAKEAADEGTIPLLGRIAAGFPIEVFANEDSVNVPRAMMAGAKRELFALRVQGDSMIDEGILNGDLVVCEKCETARSGETVVALWKGEATLKILQKARNGVELHPANPRYPVMKVGAEDSFEVQGILRGVVRIYGGIRK